MTDFTLPLNALGTGEALGAGDALGAEWPADAEHTAALREVAALLGLAEWRDYFFYDFERRVGGGVPTTWTCLFVREAEPSADGQPAVRAPRYRRLVATGRPFLQPAPSLDPASGLAHGKRGHRPPVSLLLPDGSRALGDCYDGATVLHFCLARPQPSH